MISNFGLKTVSAKAIALVVVMIVISIAATTAFLLFHFNKVLGTDRLQQNLVAAEMIINPNHEAYSVNDGKLMVGNRQLTGDEKGVDSVVSAFGGVATVFLGDTRIATTIRNHDGARAVGTTLTPGPVYDAVLRDGKQYLGEAVILGEDYVTAYKPIKDAGGNTVGIFFVGFEKSEFNKEITTAVELAAIAALLLVAVCGGIGGYVFFRLFAPFRPLSHLMEEARNGRYTDKVPYTERDDEFGELARVIEMFNKAVREREAQRVNVDFVVGSFGEALDALSHHDLTYRLTKPMPEEYRVLQQNFNQTLAQLEAAMKEIDGRADIIGRSSADINQAAQEMAKRTEREAAALEETSAAVNQLTSTVSKSVDGAKQANDAAAVAKTDAEQGSHVVRSAVDAIRAIAQSSEEISQIIGVINDIAFQTNLLALNAGVEAARAGDAGRGFAVVASEVRLLAQRSAEAAKQIRQIIVSSKQQVESGVKLVEESGGTFGKIVDEIGTVYQLVTAIADSQREQAAALQQIDAAVQQLDRTTQQNAAMAEQSCSASDTMREYAGELSQRVGQFQIGDGAPLAEAA